MRGRVHGAAAGVLFAVGVVALVFGPFATYQLTVTAPRTAALVLADLAVGWSMIAAGLIICDRRPGNRIGPLAILTGFAWFAGDFTISSLGARRLCRRPSSTAGSTHSSRSSSWPTRRAACSDPSIAVWRSGSSSSRAPGRSPRHTASARSPGGSIARRASDTVDACFAAQRGPDTLGRLETAALTALSIGVLIAVATRWPRASGAARRRQTPVVLAGIVLVLGFTGGFLLQTIVPTDARTPTGELRVLILAILRVLIAVALLVGILRDDAARAGSRLS